MTGLSAEQFDALASIFHDLDAEPRLTCTNATSRLHQNGAARVGSSSASVQVRGMIQ
jgi:hypothetical protein